MESIKPLTRPSSLERIYDVVKNAGIDVSAWHDGKGEYSTNPKFCYRWAFEGKNVALLCLWYRNFHQVDGVWTVVGNARQEQIEREAQGSDHWDPAVRNRTKRWAKSAYQLDEVIKQAMRNKLVVRVCIVDSRSNANDLETSTADFRMLDPVPWELSYEMLTGDYVVRRTGGKGPSVVDAEETDIQRAPEEPVTQKLPVITETSYGVGVVDQFIGNHAPQAPALKERIEYERSDKVRQLVMLRSRGRCEWCDAPGFKTHGGEIYLESHHVIALADKGVDHITNVIALCPNDHRMAHYGEHREAMAEGLLARVRDRNSEWLQ